MDFAVFHRQRAGGKLGRHANQRRDPHPENRPRSSGCDGRCHACNVAGSDGGRKRGRQCLEVRDVAVLLGLIIFSNDASDGMGKVTHLHEQETEGEKESGAYQQSDGRPSPNKTIDVSEQLVQSFHSIPRIMIGENRGNRSGIKTNKMSGHKKAPDRGVWSFLTASFRAITFPRVSRPFPVWLHCTACTV